MSAGSSGGPSQSSSRVTLANPIGGSSVEVDAVMAGASHQDGVPIKTSISQSHVEYNVQNNRPAAPSRSASGYALYSPFAIYYPAFNPSPTTSYSATSTQNPPCKIHGAGNPYGYSVYPQNPYANYQAQQALAPAGGGNAIAPGPSMALSASSVGPGAQVMKQEKRFIVDNGVTLVEEYINDKLVKRTVNGVSQPITKN